MTTDANLLYAPAAQAGDYRPVLHWTLLTAMLVLGLVALWQFGVIQQVLTTDHTYMSVLIAAVFMVTSVHCLVQSIIISREQIAARGAAALIRQNRGKALTIDGHGPVVRVDGQPLPAGIFSRHVANLIEKAHLRGSGTIDQTLILKNLADSLNARERLGMFVSEALLRLALLGTAVGFILMLIPIAAITGFDADTLRVALSGMSSGMAIALNVTVLGISSALILKLEYFMLDQAVGRLFSIIVDVTEIYVIPALQRDADADR